MGYEEKMIITTMKGGIKTMGDEGNTEGLNMGIGNKDFVSLQPAKVKIVRVGFVAVGTEKKNKKLTCYCQHPNK